MSKRKADVLSESSNSPEPLPPSLSSSQSSHSSGPSASENGSSTYNLWNIAGAPYFNSRTRKRFRDGRPSTETIHEITLRKLYDAQRRQEETLPSSTPDTPSHLRMPATADLIAGPANFVDIPADRHQRSIQSFFARPSSHSGPDPTTQMQPPLTTSLHQPSEHVPHLIPPHPRTHPSVLTCEDCFSPLLTKVSGEAVDAEMCDVEGPLVDLEVDEGWTCVLCTKRVCDVCAVRGDYRVCLECAVPGGGRYRPEELREKRWVGGIGWM